MEGQTEGMFSTPFFIGKLDYEYEVPEEIAVMISRTDKNLDESSEKYYDYHNVHLIHIEDLPELNSEIIKCCEKLVEDVGFVKQPMKINDLWFNIYNKNRPFLPIHWHQNCIWSGSFYPQDTNHYVSYTNPNAGYQNMYFPEVKKPSDFNQDYMRLKPTKGTIIIHPSWISHSAHWIGDEPSCSISFDVGYTGEIGSKEYGSYNDGQ